LLNVKRLNDTALLNKSSHSYTGCHLPYEITQCYLTSEHTQP